MARAETESFSEMSLELETAPGSGSYTRICGLIDINVNFAAQVDTTEVPDCDDESLPLEIEREVRSVEMTVSATGVWAQQNHGTMRAWMKSGTTRNVRLRHANAAAGDPEYETGPALLTSMSEGRMKGKKVTREIELVFDGMPTETDAT